MRSVLVVMLAAVPGPMFADLGGGPDLGAVRAATQAASAGNGSGALAFGGGWSAGIVIAPQPHPDARPWPLGAVIEPPDVDDPMAISPGCDGLQPRQPRRVTAGWRKPFADLARAADGTCPQVL